MTVWMMSPSAILRAPVEGKKQLVIVSSNACGTLQGLIEACSGGKYIYSSTVFKYSLEVLAYFPFMICYSKTISKTITYHTIS